MTVALDIKGVFAGLGVVEILKGVDLVVPFGEIHALMGPNGSGKSTLCHALMGKGDYEVTGSALVAGVEIMDLTVDQRARAGLFSAFQYPTEIPGVSLDELIAEMGVAAGWSSDELLDRERTASKQLRMAPLRPRAVNAGLSGGEKKRSEMYQATVAMPRMAVLDEIDSGLDVDAVREVAGLVEGLRSDATSVLIITHYNRILRYLRVDQVHVMVSGRIVQSGSAGLAEELEERGYEDLIAEFNPSPSSSGPMIDPFVDLP